jgi:hypothetical protein
MGRDVILLELTPDEALNLRNLLDTAVRAGGMRVAEAAIQIDAKVLAAARVWEERQRVNPAQQPQPKGNGGKVAEPQP